jgi:hypothetical protein
LVDGSRLHRSTERARSSGTPAAGEAPTVDVQVHVSSTNQAALIARGRG